MITDEWAENALLGWAKQQKLSHLTHLSEQLGSFCSKTFASSLNSAAPSLPQLCRKVQPTLDPAPALRSRVTGQCTETKMGRLHLANKPGLGGRLAVGERGKRAKAGPAWVWLSDASPRLAYT